MVLSQSFRIINFKFYTISERKWSTFVNKMTFLKLDHFFNGLFYLFNSFFTVIQFYRLQFFSANWISPPLEVCLDRLVLILPCEDQIGIWIGSDWIGSDWIGSDWIGSDWIGSDWIRTDWIESDQMARDISSHLLCISSPPPTRCMY